ncbi:MAG: hypothetical protein U0667_16365 [Chloroflexota bacterium]
MESRSLDTDHEDDPPDALDDHHRMMVSWARRFDALRTDLAAHDSARECLEARHLGGHTTLFPDDEAERRELLDATGRMAAMAALGPAPGPHEAVVAATADALLAQARAGALDLLGRHSEAGDVIAGMLSGRTASRTRPAEAAGPCHGVTHRGRRNGSAGRP